MKQGKIVRVISNQYQIYCDNELYDAIAMGKVRKGKSPIVGDLVNFEQIDSKFVIQKVLDRKNEMVRPLVANVDQVIIIMSAKDPDFSSVLVDRFIFLISYANIKPVLCITKIDLVTSEDPIYQQIEAYRKSGYEVYVTGEGMDVEMLKPLLANKISVLSGQSGAGKSSLLNRIDTNLQIRTQVTSKALGRGKHTTRHLQLFPVFGGWLADTPGFSSLSFDGLDIIQLGQSILDFKPYLGACRFNDCIHMNEPDCAIRDAVSKGLVNEKRYQHYKDIVTYIKDNKEYK